MQKISLKAQKREILGKKVKRLRSDGIIPGHVFGKNVETEHISVKLPDFKKTYSQAGETGLIDLKIGEEKIRPVLIRDVQLDPLSELPLNIDFYQVNLAEKVTVSVPIILTGKEPELVHMGEAVVIQPVSEVEVEALPAELPEEIEVDISLLKQINDALLVSDLKIPEGVIILAEPEAVVVKLDTAVTEEMKQLLEEQAAEAQQPAEEAVPAETAEGKPEGEEEKAGEAGAPAEASAGAEKPPEAEKS